MRILRNKYFLVLICQVHSYNKICNLLTLWWYKIKFKCALLVSDILLSRKLKINCPGPWALFFDILADHEKREQRQRESNERSNFHLKLKTLNGPDWCPNYYGAKMNPISPHYTWTKKTLKWHLDGLEAKIWRNKNALICAKIK